MADAMMAYPHLRHPFDEKPLHSPGSVTVLCEGRKITLAEHSKRADKEDSLLIQADALQSINGFTLKPEGACLDELCVPVRDSFFIEQEGAKWFDLTAFADLVGQPYVADVSEQVWCFGAVPAKRQNMMNNAMAPEFKVTDRQGQVVELADLKGKKALIVTWSSW